MRGGDNRTGELFSYVDLEARVRRDHPLRAIRTITRVCCIPRCIGSMRVVQIACWWRRHPMVRNGKRYATGCGALKQRRLDSAGKSLRTRLVLLLRSLRNPDSCYCGVAKFDSAPPARNQILVFVIWSTVCFL